MKVPFDYDFVENEFVGKRLVLSRNKWGSTNFSDAIELTLKTGGEADDAEGWSIEDGALRVNIDHSRGLYEFRGIESRNGVVYAVGFHNIEQGSVYRVVMHKKVSLGDDFGLCISSHVDYEADTIPVILKSLKKAGFSNPITVVIGGCKEKDDGKITEADGVKTVMSKDDAMGFVALKAIDDSKKYWMLLHDTCVVDKDFIEKASDIDIGLNPDMLLFSKLEDKSEIGIYSTEYLLSDILELDKRTIGILETMAENTTVLVEGVSLAEYEGEKDVYGGGVMRKVMAMRKIGVKKNVGRRMVGGKP